MSGSTACSTLPLADGEKTDLRRFCGYPAIGGTSSGEGSWRFFQTFGQFEWKMNNLSPTELAQVRLYLSQLYPLETAVIGASANLDTEQAASWRHNAREVDDRMGLFDLWRRRLCGFLGVPMGPDLHGGHAVVI